MKKCKTYRMNYRTDASGKEWQLSVFINFEVFSSGMRE
jgi:hypothetical protein